MSETARRFSELRLRSNYQPHEDRLHDFYIPVLERTVTYDRLVGYWRSSSLVAAAAGLTGFIRNALAHGGRMRVIAGAQLTPQDVDAIMDGEPLEEAVARRLLEEEEDPADVIARERLRLLAWMVREGLLEIKIGVPTDDHGVPLASTETEKLFHTKFGILTDTTGDKIAFQGSLNESAQGWVHNHEAFTIFRSWHPEVWEMYGQGWVETFEHHWTNRDPVKGWAILDLPEAVRAELISRVPEDWTPPELDPAEQSADAAAELERIRRAPRELVDGRVGFSTLPITPWPHQEQIAARIVDTWPRSYLLADEVGLGKTIEAGMVVRELLLSGQAERMLLLVPASVQRQWQEELWEKFCLDVPSLSKGKFLDYEGKVLEPGNTESAWNAFPVVLASSHLARRRVQREAVLRSGPWDLVLVDEAHHARRRGIGGKEGANQLLQLLREMRDAHMYRALILASATPMQMNTHEIYDLLDLFGLPGEWGKGEESFEFYYRQLAEPDPKAREWKRLRGMLADFFAQPDVEPNPMVRRRLLSLPGPSRMRIEKLHSMVVSGSQIAQFNPAERDLLDQWLRANTPIRDRVFRTTRVVLREYQKQGLLSPEATIPVRHVHDEMIDFEEKTERELYRRIEDYISRYYDAYSKSKETKPLGFIMTVYRRRLTSSLQAIHRSLVRRIRAIQEKASVDELLDDDDQYALENLALDFDDLSDDARLYAEELAELQSFVAELEAAIPNDTKGRVVNEQIKKLFTSDGAQSVVVFTQFTDTLEWLREQLRATYGSLVACYTGAGGSRWDSEAKAWVKVPKEEIKRLFRDREVKILIGTDAMSEGLNLQTCDRLINYDMPWNFMRVEQRIGRIDRIGGRPNVYVTNYFYRDTVEEQVYTGIREDAEWFRHVVGPAQPVLGHVEGVIERLAMTKAGRERDQALADQLEEVRELIREHQKKPVTLDTLAGDEITDEIDGESPFGLAQLEATLTRNPLTAPLMHPHPDFAHTYFVEVGGEKHPMTFDRKVYEANPDIGFMTYGHPVFEELIQRG